MPKQKISRRRCTECRRWFTPSAQTAHNQKTCGRPGCRRRRRARLTRRRRALSLQDSRVSERERQRESRRRRSEQRGAASQQGPPGDPVLEPSGVGGTEAMSLTGLDLEASEMMSEILKNWDTLVCGLDAQSLAGLKRHLADILGKSGHKLGQKGQKHPHVTGRPDFLSDGIYREKDLQFGTGCHWPAVTEVG